MAQAPAANREAEALRSPVAYETVDGIRRVENQVLRDTLRVGGPEWDGAVIRNNRFIGQHEQGLLVGDVDGLRIEGNRFTGMGRNAIKLKTRQRNGSRNILIQNNRFEDSPATAVLVGPPNREVRILRNHFTNVGWERTGNKQHAIYAKASGIRVEGNIIEDVPGAHGISIRSSGLVRGNRVSRAREAGIKYYASADDIGDGQLLIENNIVTECGKAGIAFGRGKGRLLRRALVRFNTLVANKTGLRLHRNMEDMGFELYGNLIVQPDGDPLTLRSKPRAWRFEQNLTQTGTSDFREAGRGDFHLTGSAAARGLVTIRSRYFQPWPAVDFDGRPFGPPPHDAGALQYRRP